MADNPFMIMIRRENTWCVKAFRTPRSGSATGLNGAKAGRLAHPKTAD